MAIPPVPDDAGVLAGSAGDLPGAVPMLSPFPTSTHSLMVTNREGAQLPGQVVTAGFSRP